VNGLFLDGSQWDYDKMQLKNPEIGTLFYEMCIIEFKPIKRTEKDNLKSNIGYVILVY